MSADWKIEHWPELTHDAFLSHCREDKDDLVFPVFQQLALANVFPWFDWQDYPVGMKSLEALRQELVKCRHVIYFITPNLLKQGRGWCAVERSCSDLIQRHFEFSSSTLWNFELPLVFLPRNSSSLKKLVPTVWLPVLERGVWFDARSDQRLGQVEWATEQIQLLLQQQRASQQATTHRLQSDPALHQALQRVPGLADRITSAMPAAPTLS